MLGWSHAANVKGIMHAEPSTAGRPPLRLGWVAASTLRVLAVVYVACVALLYIYQRKLIYHPDARHVAPASVGLAGVSEVLIETPDGERLVAWWSPPKDGKAVVLDFQGQGGAPSHRAHRILPFVADGYGILTLAYRSYGGSTGRPSESALVADGKLAFDWLRQRGIAADRIVLFGESLGTGVAVQVAADRPVAGVILDSPYSSLADVAQGRFPLIPVHWLMLDKFESAAHIPRVAAPILMYHGERDTVVPYELGKRLYAAARSPKVLLTIPNGYHTVPFGDGPWSAIKPFLERVASGR